MSIIYDALKKVENSLAKGPTENNLIKAPVSKKKVKFIFCKTHLIYGAIVLLGFVFSSLMFNFLSAKLGSRATSTPPSPPPHSPAPTIAQPLPEPEVKDKPGFLSKITNAIDNKKTSANAQSFTLTGVFFADNQWFALINNRVVKVGDNLKGAIVTQISLDQVELKSEEQTVILSIQK